MPIPARRAALLLLSLGAGAAHASGIAVQVRDGAGQALADVVVYAEPEGAAAPRTMRAGSIEQKGLKFLPLVTVVQTGSSVAFPNNDKVRHHIYSFSPAKKFDQKLYAGIAASPQVFDKAGVVVLGCNIHDKMLAYVKVVDTPYFAKTDGAGAARIELPGGKYVLRAWHFRAVGGAAAEQALLVKGGDAPSPAAFTLTLKPAGADGDSAADAGL
ncbi:methylamine utilization protein [Janthinobacterium fluminis]|uniref:Methylamine utilization protein n=1 Tax=Janthinobacterium fluminis TaxID=2987524 RepID=A0ABT5JX09_9BURK|nr:methylamine utilization protein [Janthinobacterium fluminis]MDC8756700.1 methylamine utilization protein [Janthinobacterium fluminis]